MDKEKDKKIWQKGKLESLKMLQMKEKFKTIIKTLSNLI